MFTGIVQGMATIISHQINSGGSRLTLELPEGSEKSLQIGASIAVDGTCLTTTEMEGRRVHFDLVGETLAKTSLGIRAAGDKVNIERAAKIGSEIGGHLMSGHVSDIAKIIAVEEPEGNHILTLSVNADLMKYILPKGFIGLDGCSLTIVDTDAEMGTFTVWLIPETLSVTCFGHRGLDALVNVEIDSQTQAVVDTVISYMENNA
ncbi:MAG: riboflavin synthase subunit alpha [Euryarchaeota archaeon]|nr:riboflavin synthase subunit alpha [Euryarchaeota archaeon]